MREFKMPALGADMEAGLLVEWLVEPGDKVASGDIVCVVETQKGAIDVEIFEDGVIEELVVQPGEEVPVGATLARLDGKAAKEEGAAQAPKPLSLPKWPPPPLPSKAGRPAPRHPPVATAPPPAGGRAMVSPAARRRADELGLDPATLTGTGIDGSVTLADVEAAARAPLEKRPAATPPRPAAEAKPARKGFDPGEMRKAIAAAMQRSKREIPHYYLGQTIDFAAAADWLAAANASKPPPERLMPAVLLLKATALALAEVPALNGHYEDGAFRPGDGIHVGWIVALRGGGLVAPAIRDADKLGLPELMTALRDLVQRARTGGLRASELGSGTITVTSLGERGADSVIGVIYPPQVAIVGFGRIATRPWVVDGAVTARPLVETTLAADHRVCDGHLGGLLLAAIDRFLQAPEGL
jgi:pyruvate dehydrogenase E2 component (dihydrolipoamide acetyltransferase)